MAKEAFLRQEYQIAQCCECGYLFVTPRPPLDKIIAHYAQSYRGATADFYPKAGDRRWRGFWRSLLFIPYITGKKVLDLGCGGGFMVEAFARFAREAVGVDLSENSIAYAQKRWPKYRFFAEGLAGRCTTHLL
ncbi:bifunctional 2-polyprenyl-6-hydroxyphenol methylase/3-demethylubiquinol 3-O-methyltransferase UbiG [Acidocella sp.]|uniref:class I SAM-dependent methyltransferase n=1 Tax=Acidocella sp. TaxID=50710 RepID=UPI002629E066|nr:class I SAM-dependent methyltransferase [Acidocella sp.]